MLSVDDHVAQRWVRLVALVIGAMMVALMIQWALVKPYRIPSSSMAPTLTDGQRVLVDRLSARFEDPKVGEVWVFHPPRRADLPTAAAMCARPTPADEACIATGQAESEATYIKRVVGIGGDRLEVVEGQVIRNGRPVTADGSVPCDGIRCTQREFRVPAGHYFMMGDNRGASEDSRFWGPVRRDAMIGRAVATYWPIKRIGSL